MVDYIFQANHIGLIFGLYICVINIAEWAEENGRGKISNDLGLIGLLISLYFVFAGIYMIMGGDPFAETGLRSQVTGRDRRAVNFVINYWPHMLTAMGASLWIAVLIGGLIGLLLRYRENE